MKRRAVVLCSLLVVALLVVSCAPAAVTSPRARALAAGSPIVLTKISISPPNSVGGIDVVIEGDNVGDRTIEKIEYGIQAFDSAGSPVTINSAGVSITFLRSTGPYQPGDAIGRGYHWPHAMYGYSVRCVEVYRMKVTFSDGSDMPIAGARLRASMANQQMNDCRQPGS